MKIAAKYVYWTPEDSDSTKTLKDWQLPTQGRYRFEVTYRPANKRAPVHIYTIKAPNGEVFKAGEEFDDIADAAYSYLHDMLKNRAALARLATELEQQGFMEFAAQLDLIATDDEEEEEDERQSMLNAYRDLISDWEEWLEKRHTYSAHDTAPGPNKYDEEHLGIEAKHIQKEMLGLTREIDVHESDILFKIKNELDKLKAELRKKKSH